MIKLTAVIITFNEEKNIGRCLESLRGIADEIVVVDSGSTDRTKEICIAQSVKFIEHPFQGHIEQKNYALAFCSNDYILSVDADESLSTELRDSIIKIKSNWMKHGYYFNRLTNYCGKWIHHCGWYPDKKLRIFMKGKGKWAGENPHDRFVLDDENNSDFINGDLLHYSYYSVDDHMQQAIRFSNIAAMSAFQNGKRSSLIHVLVRPKLRFIRDYILRLGILDGYYGLVICRISSHATFLKYVKLLELQKKIN